MMEVPLPIFSPRFTNSPSALVRIALRRDLAVTDSGITSGMAHGVDNNSVSESIVLERRDNVPAVATFGAGAKATVAVAESSAPAMPAANSFIFDEINYSPSER